MATQERLDVDTITRAVAVLKQGEAEPGTWAWARAAMVAGHCVRRESWPERTLGLWPSRAELRQVKDEEELLGVLHHSPVFQRTTNQIEPWRPEPEDVGARDWRLVVPDQVPAWAPASSPGFVP